MEGWLKLHRGLLDWEWYTNSITKDVFIHCLLKANYETKKWQGRLIPPGSFITSYRHIADELNISVQNVRTAISNLELTHELTHKSTHKHTLITIENWAKYQDVINQTNTVNNTQTNIQLTTTKEIKNIYINLINKYKERPKTFYEKMKFYRKIKNDDIVKSLSVDDEYKLKDLILGGNI